MTVASLAIASFGAASNAFAMGSVVSFAMGSVVCACADALIATAITPSTNREISFMGVLQSLCLKIWVSKSQLQLPGGFQVSGLYLYSSGIRQQATYGQDVRNAGAAELGGGRLRADGTVIPRNSVVNDPVHRVDVRVQWRLQVGRARFEPLVEVFNLFNATNFTRNWVELNPQYGRATGQSTGSEYRQLQLGFRTTF